MPCIPDDYFYSSPGNVIIIITPSITAEAVAYFATDKMGGEVVGVLNNTGAARLTPTPRGDRWERKKKKKKKGVTP